MIRRKRDRLGVSYAKQIVMKRFLDRLRRWGPKCPTVESVYKMARFRPTVLAQLTAVKHGKQHF